MEEEVITISDEEVEVIDEKEGQVEFEPGPEGRDGPRWETVGNLGICNCWCDRLQL